MTDFLSWLKQNKNKGALRGSVLLFVFGICFFAPEATRNVGREALSSAYVSVSTFVAFTLALFYALEHLFKLDTDDLLNRYPKWHIPIAAVMGALPGCGGAIIVMTQYVSGRLGFGSMVAVLTATMGDAAFLLLAREPETALLVYAISLAVGIVSGYIVELIHGRDFLRKEQETKKEFMAHAEMPDVTGFLQYPWIVLMLPGLALGAANALQIDSDAWFGAWSVYQPTLWIGFWGAVLSIVMWALNPNSGPSIVNLSGKMIETKGWKVHLERVIIDTNFVTVWVVMAFLAFELSMHWGNFDLKSVFAVWQPVMPLMAVLIGFIPGCGPQILVTTFYLNGLIPLSAQLGNAISNDGDALFPAIALAPKTAILATLYTSIPAMIVAYGWYFLME
ncbi:MAG TPA: putative manganese transporter [Alphaproteobacteria bacterium]|nr:putative manganese transporter [Alphaproteobacteria bacterium]